MSFFLLLFYHNCQYVLEVSLVSYSVGCGNFLNWNLKFPFQKDHKIYLESKICINCGNEKDICYRSFRNDTQKYPTGCKSCKYDSHKKGEKEGEKLKELQILKIQYLSILHLDQAKF